MGGTTIICEKCKEACRICDEDEKTLFMSEHKLKCDGRIKSLWENFDNMPIEQKEILIKQVMGRQGKLGKIYDEK